MIWERISDYAIKSGPWLIAKYVVGGKPVYGVCFKHERRGYFDDLAKAKALAETPVETLAEMEIAQ